MEAISDPRMSVTQTKEPYTLRVNFFTVDEPRKQTESVCYLHINEFGRVDMYYSHEATRIRALDNGPWEQDNITRMPMSQVLRAQVFLAAMRALCSTMVNETVKVLTIPPGDDPTRFGKFFP